MNIKFVKVEVLLPEAYIERIRNELNKLGVLTVGNYENVYKKRRHRLRCLLLLVHLMLRRYHIA